MKYNKIAILAAVLAIVLSTLACGSSTIEDEATSTLLPETAETQSTATLEEMDVPEIVFPTLDVSDGSIYSRAFEIAGFHQTDYHDEYCPDDCIAWADEDGSMVGYDNSNDITVSWDNNRMQDQMQFAALMGGMLMFMPHNDITQVLVDNSDDLLSGTTITGISDGHNYKVSSDKDGVVIVVIEK